MLGAEDLKISTRRGKKYMALWKGKWVHFGARGMSDFTIHRDKKRRDRYRVRHSKLRTKDGRIAYQIKGSPAFFSWHLLW
jgi:hypothetical protein